MCTLSWHSWYTLSRGNSKINSWVALHPTRMGRNSLMPPRWRMLEIKSLPNIYTPENQHKLKHGDVEDIFFVSWGWCHVPILAFGECREFYSSFWNAARFIYRRNTPTAFCCSPRSWPVFATRFWRSTSKKRKKKINQTTSKAKNPPMRWKNLWVLLPVSWFFLISIHFMHSINWLISDLWISQFCELIFHGNSERVACQHTDQLIKSSWNFVIPKRDTDVRIKSVGI